ncbi:hypothetical protein V2G26_001879 [Clonostachys chloroleuca]|uniref:Phospholipase/carboxylesterase/thioesterase domain-containing protein n=1 Tax=Clonostachys chloroleuca TaxID=1926264 RepID=A0AA35LQW1_9HYPO|nr:unnamed protein product [Clonostachys chloroleuca]
MALPPRESTIIEPTAPHTHTHTVVFLHGRGDSAAKLASSLAYSPASDNQTLPGALPGFRWVFPSAPIEATALNPTERRAQWFDVWNVRDLADREELQAEGLRASVGRVRELVRAEAGRVGGLERVVVMGISQGGATGVHVLLSLGEGERLGAFVGVSCRMVFPGRSLGETRGMLGMERGDGDDDDDDDDKEVSEAVRRTPVMLQHCVDDTVVRVEDGRVLRETLERFGGKGKRVEWREYLNGGHWFNSPAGTDDIVEFLSRELGVAPAVVGPAP